MAQKEKIRDISKTELESLIDEWVVGKHAERNRKIMRRRLIDGICYEPLAEEFDMSDKQIRNIVKKNQGIILRHIPSVT